jgi:hypothetical protein
MPVPSVGGQSVPNCTQKGHFHTVMRNGAITKPRVLIGVTTSLNQALSHRVS